MIPDTPVYYINLEESSDRRVKVENELINMGFKKYFRVSAVDGRGVDLTTLIDYDDNASVASLGRSVTGGEYGCYKSHIKALKLVLAGNADFAVVIEDDVILDQGWADAVQNALEALVASDFEFDVMHLAADRLKIFSPIFRLPDGQDVVAAHYFPMTTSALLWSRAGAKKFLMDSTTVEMPIDHKLREVMVRSGKGLAVWPAIAQQSGQDSDIDDVNAKRGYATRKWFYGLVKQRRLLVNKGIAFLRLIEARVAKKYNPESVNLQSSFRDLPIRVKHLAFICD